MLEESGASVDERCRTLMKEVHGKLNFRLISLNDMSFADLLPPLPPNHYKDQGADAPLECFLERGPLPSQDGEQFTILPTLSGRSDERSFFGHCLLFLSPELTRIQ